MKRNYFTKSLNKSVITEKTLRLSKRRYEGHLRVPMDTPRSTLNPNFIVFIHYSLQVKLKTGNFHYDTDISAPLVIGTVPLERSLRAEILAAATANSIAFSNSGNNNNNNNNTIPITTQPTGRRHPTNNSRNETNQTVDTITEEEMEEFDIIHDEDEPPSYDSCCKFKIYFIIIIISCHRIFT